MKVLRNGLVVVALLTLLAAVPAVAQEPELTPEPYLATRSIERAAVAGGGYVAWTAATAKNLYREHLFLRDPDGEVMRLNLPKTQARLGGIEGGRLIFQEFGGTSEDNYFPSLRDKPKAFSRIVIYDLLAGERSVPEAVNSDRWQFSPRLSGDSLIYGEIRRPSGPQRLHLYNLRTGSYEVLTRLESELNYYGSSYVAPGQLNGDWAVWRGCIAGCGIVIHNIRTGYRYELSENVAGRSLAAPSISSEGTVYLASFVDRELGQTFCPSNLRLERFALAPDGTYETSVRTPILGINRGMEAWYTHVDEEGGTSLLFQHGQCWRDGKQPSDVYRVTDVQGLEVQLQGVGQGVVTSAPAGISCPMDCTEQFPGGAVVRLQAQPYPGSRFAGWTGACEGLGECLVQLHGARSVGAVFEPGG